MRGLLHPTIDALAFAALLSFSGCATPPAPPLDRVSSTVSDFLEANGRDFSAYEDSDLSDPDRYYRHERRYSVAAPVGDLWSLYTTVDPLVAWGTDMTRFGVVWDPASQRLFGAGDECVPPFAPGQIYVLELELAGVYHIPAAFRITKIDIESFSIEFVYLKANKSNGVQRILFLPATDGGGKPCTIIEHRTWYRSGGGFRDRHLYRRFHAAIIDGFHRGITRSGGYELLILN